MGRFETFPQGYQPNLIFDLRVKEEGGGLLDPGEIRGDLGVFSRRECLILVHGFNNHAGEAAIAYQGFRRRECQRFSDLRTDALEKLLGDTFWPGDAEWAGPIDRVDFLVYPRAVGIAERAGTLLGEMIESLSKMERIHFLGHSLGCRLVLETLLYLRNQHYPLAKIGGVCLMAAAVPTEMVERNGRFASLLDELSTVGAKILVLHSAKDTVLRFAFPPGQTLAGDGEGWFPTALGRFGPPHGMRGAVFQEAIEGAGHSDYWGHKKTEASEASTAAAGEFFKLGDGPREMTPRRYKVGREVA